MSRYCGRGYFQCLHPEQQQWLLIRFLLSLLLLPILHLHHQLLLLSQTERPSPRGAFHPTVSSRSNTPPPHLLPKLEASSCSVLTPKLTTGEVAHASKPSLLSRLEGRGGRPDLFSPDYAYYECEDADDQQTLWEFLTEDRRPSISVPPPLPPPPPPPPVSPPSRLMEVWRIQMKWDCSALHFQPRYP